MPVLATNKKATFDYKIIETFEAGLVLFGHEVKAIKDGHVSLKGSYISFRYDIGKPELFLIGAHISKYRHAGGLENYNPIRERKILLKNKEINHLLGKKEENGLTLVPVKIYTSRSLIKMELALAEGKKKFDKRADLKKKDLDRQISTLMKRRLGQGDVGLSIARFLFKRAKRGEHPRKQAQKTNAKKSAAFTWLVPSFAPVVA